MKTLRFRSFAERKSLAGILIIACASMSACLFAQTAGAAGIESLKQIIEKCGKLTPSSLNIYEEQIKFSAEKNKGELKADFNPALQCRANSGEELQQLSHNARAVAFPNWKRRPSYLLHNLGEVETRKLGACRVVYQSIKDLFDRHHEISERHCRELTMKMKMAVECSPQDKKCEDSFLMVKQELAHHEEQAKALTEEAKHYLEVARKSSLAAKLKYEEDLKAITTEAQKEMPGPTISTMDAVMGRPDLKPSNGNAQSRNFGQYYELLSSAATLPVEMKLEGQLHRADGGLIKEHEEAAHTAKEFEERFLREIKYSLDEVTGSAKKMVDTILAEIKKNESVRDGALKGLSDHGSTLTGAGALGQKMMENGASKTPTVPSVSGGSSVGSLAALAAASAGVAGAAFQRAGGSSSSTAATPSEMTNQPAVPKTALLESATAGDKNAALNSGTDGQPPSAKVDVEKADSSAGGYPAFGASDGSSRMISGAKKTSNRNNPAHGSVSDPGTEDAIHTFGSGGMAPRPSPKSNAVSPGAEVANLLGQMKNLFNFDEGAPMGGGPALDGSNHAGAAASTQTPEEGVPGDIEEEPSGEESTADTEANPYGHEKDVQAAQFGKLDTTLFARVRIRHARAMERGLVLYQLGERVE